MKTRVTGSPGVSLLEIIIAVAILTIAVVPIYFHMARDVAVTFETEKIQMADKILESVKEEMTAMPFMEFYNRTKDMPDPDGPFSLTDGYYPITLDQVLEIQREHKDFEVVGTWTYVLRSGKLDKTMVQVDLRINWNQPGKLWERTRSFLLIQP